MLASNEMPLPFVTIAATTAADYSMSLLYHVPDETPLPYMSFTFPSQLAVHTAFNLFEYTQDWLVLLADDTGHNSDLPHPAGRLSSAHWESSRLLQIRLEMH